MDNDAQAKKWINFYFRLRKQYQEGKPFTYQLDLISNQPKPRAAKFMIMVTKFVSIYKWGLREVYENQDDRRDNYWSELNKHFNQDYQMGFVNEMYWEKPKNKIKKYFALLIYTKRIFTVLERIINQMGYLFQNQEEKRKNYAEEIKNLEFLADGQYKVMGQLITSYEEYANKRRQVEIIKEIQRAQKEKQAEERRKLNQLRELQQRKQKQEKQRLAKEEQERKKEIERKIQQAKKKQEQEDARKIITSEYFPQNYKPAFSTPERKPLSKDPSRGNLQLPNSQWQNHRIKNSEKLFRERFKDELEVFAYSLKPEISEDKTICFACKQNLKQGLYILGGNSNLCYYTGKWYCNNDIAEERMSIPWKAIQNFDLRGYTVCKAAYAQLKTYYEKPIIQISKNNPIIEQNRKLHDFLVIKRQMHLIYDSICNLALIEPLLKKRENYCLQINLFSMKNLYDIYNGQQIIKLQRDYQILSKHFYRCDICQKKRGYICPVCKDPVKIFPFEIRETLGCSACRKLYHKKCLTTGKCKCKEED